MPRDTTPLVIGVDPGTRRTGYGVITLEPQPRLVASGVIRPGESLPIEKRLHLIHQDLLALIAKHQPALVAVEEPYFGKSAKSSMAVGQAQAIALVAAASHNVPLTRCQPSQVKLHTAGRGNASKDDIRRAIQAAFQLPNPPPSDEADALAVAFYAVNARNEAHALTKIHTP